MAAHSSMLNGSCILSIGNRHYGMHVASFVLTTTAAAMTTLQPANRILQSNITMPKVYMYFVCVNQSGLRSYSTQSFRLNHIM